MICWARVRGGREVIVVLVGLLGSLIAEVVSTILASVVRAVGTYLRGMGVRFLGHWRAMCPC